MKKIPVGVLGATGMVGQQYVSLLESHPWFELNYLAASEKSSGKTYAEAIKNRVLTKYPFSQNTNQMIVHTVSKEPDAIELAKSQCKLLFSALDTEPARLYEESFAASGFPVFSNASFHRKSKDIPVLIPEINPHHLDILPTQQKNRGFTSGFIVVKPNCSIQSYLLPLYVLHLKYPIDKVIITTMQAISGAGYPGVASYDILDNVIPFISGEEEKSELEPLKILGKIQGDEIIPFQDIILSAHCNRVPVSDGHLATVSVGFKDKIPTTDEILKEWKNYKALPQVMKLPSAPRVAIIYKEEENRPQPKLDRNLERGMSTVVGRLRQCPALHYKFVGLSHNTLRGAAAGGILNAEFMIALEKIKF